jgi:hypothetical protein
VSSAVEKPASLPQPHPGPELAFALLFIFIRIFRPKIACQAPKSPKPFKQKKIELAYFLCVTRYNENRIKKPGASRASLFNEEKLLLTLLPGRIYQ